MSIPSQTWFDAELKVIRIRYTGLVTFEVVTRMAREALALVRQHGVTHAVSEFFEVETAFTTAEIYELPQAFQNVAQEMGVPIYKVRQALVATRGLEDMEFFTTVASNRGQHARAFSSLDEALAWLRSAPGDAA